MSYTSKQRSQRKKRLLVTLAILLVAALSIGGFMAYRTSNRASSTDTSDGINLAPPTEDDIKEAERHKQRLIDEEQKPGRSDPPEGQKRTVNPVIGFIQQSDNKNVESNGYITEAIEDDGTCTLTLEKNGQKVSVSKKAMPDAQSTVCGLMTIERSRLSPGEWTATLNYSSSKNQGASKAVKIRVD
jgi:hypothetical protein